MEGSMIEAIKTYLGSKANKLVILIVFLVSLGIGIGVGYSLMDRSGTAESAPVNESVFSEGEICAYIWNHHVRLPNTYPCQQRDFNETTAEATYLGSGIWQYHVSGLCSLDANFYEKTFTFEVVKVVH